METPKLNFKPCSGLCPAVTGKPHGEVKYCPMQENARHHKQMDDTRTEKINGEWMQRDWRDGKWHYQHKGNHSMGIPPHPDETNCCLNFQCCQSRMGEYAHIFHALADAAKSGQHTLGIGRIEGEES